MTELTKRQRQVLDYIQSVQQTAGATPTLREIAAHFGFASSRASADHLVALKRKGFISSEPNKARSLRIITPLAKPKWAAISRKVGVAPAVCCTDWM